MLKGSAKIARKASIEDRFEFDGDGVPTTARAELRATLFEVTERESGDAFCLKLWRKTGTAADAELRELWRHEMRHVQRVMAHSGAQGVVVDVIEFVEDEHDFGVLMERAGRPLSVLRTRLKASHWLRSLGVPAHRARLWRNVRRLVIALGIVHGQGLVHGRVGEDVVFSAGDMDPDFRLAGFEWSLWIDAQRRGVGTTDKSKIDQLGDAALSFADDWKALGRMVCGLLGVIVDAWGGVGPETGRSMPHLTAGELRWLRRVCRPRAHEGLEAHALARSCKDLVVEVGSVAGQHEGRYTLLIRAAGLAEAVYDASGGSIAIDERGAQRNFVSSDLDSGATLYVPVTRDEEVPRLYLVTQRLVYRLRTFLKDGSESWEIAVSDKTEVRKGELPFGARFHPHELDVAIDVATSDREAEELRDTVGRASLSWEALAGPPTEEAVDEYVQVRSALHLIEVIGAVVKSLDILPVEVLRQGLDGRGQVVVRALPDSDRDRLAREIGIGDASRTLQSLEDLFEHEGRDSGVRWRISSGAHLGASRARDVGVNYVGKAEIDGLDGYCFDLDGELPQASQLYLRPEQETGTEQQIKRRMRNIEALDMRLDLVAMLADPWRARRKLRHPVNEENDAFRRLDVPKQSALRLLWVTAAGFWIVGPPGVGKTMLATAIVETIFRHDPTSRVLICAQGHDALNHIEERIAALKAEGAIGKDLLMVRSMAMSEKVKSPRRVDLVADEALSRFMRSALVESAPEGLRRHLEQLSGVGEATDEDGQPSGVLSSLTMEAANIVVTTLNSSDIERMVVAREPFDWVIVEEAAKATGPELAGALALGSRRLLIGDHRQLPPYDAERLGKIFGNASLVGKMLATAQNAVRSLFDEAVLDQLTKLLGNEKHKDEILLRAQRFVEPFKTVVEEDELRAKMLGQPQQLSATLTVQRRMDPAIAELVSRTFYEGRLVTDEGREEEALKGTSPIQSSAALTASPIVVIDFPHVSATKKREGAERARPKWHNPAEIDAVLDVLRHLRSEKRGAERPTLAVLSPYASQVALLKRRLEVALKKGLAHIDEGFATVRPGMGYVGTVDSFQGSEADVVIMSLVRNNARVGLGALGFLRERRRMNVMLSRAKRNLVLVGSLSFLEEAVRGVNPDGSADHELAFITEMVGIIRRLTAQERRPGVPLASILAPEVLKGQA